MVKQIALLKSLELLSPGTQEAQPVGEFQGEKEDHREQVCEHRSNSDAENSPEKARRGCQGGGCAWPGQGAGSFLPCWDP